MARINTNVSAIVAQRHLTTSYGSRHQTIQRLSTGLRINRGADDPAGLIVSERLRSEIAATNQAVSNTQRASTIIATTEGALNEVSSLLTDIQNLVVESANRGALSDDEIRANQLQVDSAIDSITRIANSTSFAGRQLLNGSLDYVTSGVDRTVVDALSIHGAQFGSRAYIPVDVQVTTSAQPAQLFYTSNTILGNGTISIQGNTGVTTLPFTSGTGVTSMVDAINSVSGASGVTARLTPPTGFVLESENLGSRQLVRVQTLGTGSAFNLFNNPAGAGTATNHDNGIDALALVNGASLVGDGNNFSYKTSTLEFDLQLDRSFGVGSTQFAITSGGARFQVGPEVNTNLQVNIGVQSVASTNLGNNDLGFLSQMKQNEAYSLVAGQESQAQKIIGEAIRQVAVLRGRLGAFEKNTLDTNKNSLGITMENLMAAESSVRDADFAQETSNLSRAQILVSAGTSVLAIANQTPQSVLRLLGG